ncbi:hypothetical protein AA101099_2144 [Neoasaia chiangmaiensis NBRC 101099]|uniref:DUF6468 domain-containing protein n=1 Tax=Neoasaia chiangmaiensis TaxID=320497 RepID=A0A1U9KSU0_9PROT|nr:DUF6468 domain-containing protein [Neoasaia chiangmaiensis]AQS88878.1 hypothetical protein A0U93_14200 [Neoasaia chiangmaiensis]GBR40503.1 hypothetical protein AA101099_2144 [Neoasaia chiangmaiensis NBRC 101099]GEN13868.1 hypothetical protein NCH01_02990 [Neoasaia chiangmaiensis]
MSDLQICIEVTLSFLLVLSIFYSLHLARALSVLKRDRNDINTLIKTLERSTDEARRGIDHLRLTTEMVERQLGKTVGQGKTLRQELATLCERGEALADQIEHYRPAVRGQVVATPKASPDLRERREESVRSSRSEAERELIRALKLQRA